MSCFQVVCIQLRQSELNGVARAGGRREAARTLRAAHRYSLAPRRDLGRLRPRRAVEGALRAGLGQQGDAAHNACRAAAGADEEGSLGPDPIEAHGGARLDAGEEAQLAVDRLQEQVVDRPGTQRKSGRTLAKTVAKQPRC